jgi:hypothetical protein
MIERFETVMLGRLDLGEAEIDLRIVRVSPGGTYGVVFGGSLAEAALPSVEAAKQLAGKDAEVTWRDNLDLQEDERPCALCSAPVLFSPRTPERVCVVCTLEAVDAKGLSLRFSNDDTGGGFVAVASDGRRSAEHVCFVRGVRCWADEAYFGGIALVVRPLE